MELSTIMPTPSTRLDMVTTFKEKPMALIRIKAARMEIGMEVPTISDALISPKKRKMITMEMTTAITMVCITLFKEEVISSLVSLTVMISRFSSASIRVLMVLFTDLDTSTAEALCCFLMPTEMVSSPL